MIDPLNIKVIGAGGIGLWLLTPLCTHLNFLDCKSIIVTVIDGDSYEEGNRSRQLFSRVGNKAEVAVDDLTPKFEKVYFSHRAKYLTPKNVIAWINEGDIVLSCVDNHATRKLLSDHCCNLRNVTLISGGNGFTDGNVQIHIRKNGIDQRLPVANAKYHPEIVTPTDNNPGIVVSEVRDGCQVLAPSAPQLVVTNFAIASTMLNCFYGFVHGTIDYDEVFADVVMNKVRPVNRTNPER